MCFEYLLLRAVLSFLPKQDGFWYSLTKKTLLIGLWVPPSLKRTAQTPMGSIRIFAEPKIWKTAE
jgi:hypothetical protein